MIVYSRSCGGGSGGEFEMATCAPIKFEPDLPFEQGADTRGSVVCMIKQTCGCFSVISNRAECTIARMTQQTTYQIRRVIMIDLSSFAFMARGALAALCPKKYIELFYSDAISKPQVASTQRTKFIQGVFDRRCRRASCALRSHIMPARPATCRAFCNFRPGCLIATSAAKTNISVLPHERLTALFARKRFLRRPCAPSAARATAKTPTTLSTSPTCPTINERLTAGLAFEELTFITAKTPSSERPHKWLAALCTFRARPHSSKVTPRADSPRTACLRTGGIL